MRGDGISARAAALRMAAASAATGLGIFLLLVDLALFVFYRPSVEALILGLALGIAGSLVFISAAAAVSAEALNHSRRSSHSLRRIASSRGLAGDRLVDSMLKRLAHERPDLSRGAALALIPPILMAAELAYLLLFPGLLGPLGLALFFLGSLVAPVALLISQIYFSDELGRWLERHSALEADLVAALHKDADPEDLKELGPGKRRSSPIDVLVGLLTLGLYLPVPLAATAFQIAGHLRAHEELEDSLRARGAEGLEEKS